MNKDIESLIALDPYDADFRRRVEHAFWTLPEEASMLSRAHQESPQKKAVIDACIKSLLERTLTTK